ncbi:-diketo-d-gluconic acid reductase [Stylonychia lemnae]|uniref:-diketo-d-gluconic acid reductase n=1 Tax=Stylonychia lemnae TaxID=5949 RepID=A0A078BA18_STYLE|nr:-diketo-d-gluconic acid reductase [Stylonychia lemnae]|eukprot:CDW91355.1 -diketo-d-gluconic acid reductase [Stylonychia lemnae]
MEKGTKLLSKFVILNNGVQIPQIGFGTYQISTPEPIQYALIAGYRLIDSAAGYRNEKMIGDQVKQFMKQSGVPRDQIYITSKISPDQMGITKSQQCIDNSLRSFDLNYIDLMLIHYPGTKGLKKNDPLNKQNRIETWRVLEEYVGKGLIKSIGVSNFTKTHLEQILEIAQVKPVINQIELHPLYVEKETINYCNKNQILVEAYSPLARYNEQLVKDQRIIDISQEINQSVSQTILKWHLEKNFIPLPKSVNFERINENIQLDGFDLNKEQIEVIDQLSEFQNKVCWDPRDVE